MTTRLWVQSPWAPLCVWIEIYLQVENTGSPVLLFTFFEGCFFLMIFSVASCCKAGSSSSSAIDSGTPSQHARREFALLTHSSIKRCSILVSDLIADLFYLAPVEWLNRINRKAPIIFREQQLWQWAGCKSNLRFLLIPLNICYRTYRDSSFSRTSASDANNKQISRSAI